MIRNLIIAVVALGLIITVVIAEDPAPPSLASASASFWGVSTGDAAGSDVAGAGDVNNDGYQDFLVTAIGGVGRAYLILGKSSGWARDVLLSEAGGSLAGGSFLGESSNDKAGSSAVGVGDVNGDGIDDFVIGAWNNSENGARSGEVYVIFGERGKTSWGTDVSLAGTVTNTIPSFRGSDGDSAGTDVAAAGDVNNDGFADFLIGAPQANSSAGKVYLVFGSNSGWASDTDLSSVAIAFTGATGDIAGQSVSGVGDVNGDGYDDFVVGASGNNLAYLVLGKATASWPAAGSSISLAASANATFEGATPDESAGSAVAGAGDVDGGVFARKQVGVDGVIEGTTGDSITVIEEVYTAASTDRRELDWLTCQVWVPAFAGMTGGGGGAPAGCQ